eukprot:2348861-Prymnesium_polylepis.1
MGASEPAPSLQIQAAPRSVECQYCLHDAEGTRGKQCEPLWTKSRDFDFAAARSAVAYGDDFTGGAPG